MSDLKNNGKLLGLQEEKFILLSNILDLTKY